ncbi:MAG: alpha/beta hydrolase [Chitinophagaceae bacterium]|nr:alpha/beta hydrolase [Chitinophagaceae bacterium]
MKFSYLFVILFMMITAFSFKTNAQVILPLYEKEIPNSIAGPDEEQSVTEEITRISKVSVPTLIMYTPAAGKANGTAVIICPGGGYGILAIDHEGHDVAKKFNEMGVTAFVLKYRLPNDRIMVDRSIGPLQDAQRAIQMVRSNASQWNINPKKIGIMGFSAGGHLASTAGTHFKDPLIENPQKISLRPDFMILIYPVISFTDSLGHMGSRNNLIGKNPSAEQILLYSNELQVTKKTAPTFLVHAKDDGGVKFENSVRFYQALRQKKVPTEIYLYEKGGHGFGLNNKTSNVKWMDVLNDWMRKMKLI